MRRKLGTALLAVVCVIAGWLSYDNVLSDPGPVSRLAEQQACTIKPCDQRHGMTKMERTPLGQTVELTWRDGTVVVSCRREMLVFGERVCRVQ